MTVSNSTMHSVFSFFDVSTGCPGSMVVKVLDMKGRIAKTIKQNMEESIDNICLNIEDLRRGKYIINIFKDDNFVKAVPYTKG